MRIFGLLVLFFFIFLGGRECEHKENVISYLVKGAKSITVRDKNVNDVETLNIIQPYNSQENLIIFAKVLTILAFWVCFFKILFF